jgi:tRNA pseudouridine13 synthase
MTDQTAYSTSTPPLGGILKQRYTDFLVEEVRPDGTVCEIKRFLAEDALNHPTPIELPTRPADERTYSHLHCTLEKFNADMPFVLKRLSRFLHISPKRIGYAGLKDKRGITSQRISLFDPDLEAVLKFRSPTLDLRDFSWSKDRIELGDLTGNRFILAIRGLEQSTEEIERIIHAFFAQAEREGLANLFGSQRFGGIRANTHLVGKLLLKGNLEEALLLYLTMDSPRETEELRKIRRDLAESRDYLAALRSFPRQYRFERTLCQHLHNQPADFAGAIQKLPPNMRYLFTHAWQSHLFNELVKLRLQRGFGLAPIEGDVLEDGIPTLPLFGYESAFDEGPMKELEQAVLSENGFDFRDFYCQKVPELSSKGFRRKIAIKPQNAKLLDVSADEFNEGKKKAVVSFGLDKGTYATTVLAELCKNDPHQR